MGTRGIRVVSGHLQIGYTYQGQRRREVLPWRDTPTNRAKAELLKAELNEATDEQALFRAYERYYPQSRYYLGQTVAQYLTTWIEAAWARLSPSTRKDYLNSIEHHLVPEFGALHVQQLRWHHVRAFAERFEGKREGKKDAGRKRLANLLVPLRAACERAVEDGQLTVSPFHGKRLPRTPKAAHVPDPFSPTEIQALLAKAPPGFGNFIEFACWTGLRTGELIALEWGDVDWVHGVVRVRHSQTLGVKKGPKTVAGERDVVLLPPAAGALTRQKALTLLAGGRVFLDPLTEKPWANDSAIRKRWIPLLTRAGVRYRRPYSTRDTYASLLLSAGENPSWVAAQMGHRDWSVLRRSYAAWIDEVGQGGKRITAALTAGQRQENGNSR